MTFQLTDLDSDIVASLSANTPPEISAGLNSSSFKYLSASLAKAVGFRTGKISASGTGPAPYDVTGGAFDFRGAEGQFDSIFNTSTFQLTNFQTVGEVCF